MLITNYLEIILSNKNVGYYRENGYPDVKSGDLIKVKISEMPFNCKRSVDVKCDGDGTDNVTGCGEIHSISIRSYNRNIENYGYYACPKCCYDKIKLTNNERCGKDHPNQLDENRKITGERTKEYYSNLTEEDIEQQKDENVERWGKPYFMATDEFREKRKVTMIEKTGFEHRLQNPITLQEWVHDNIERTGFAYPFNNMEKVGDTKELLYGDRNYNNREQYKETNLIRLGVEHPMQNKDILQKARNTLFRNYNAFFAAQVPELYDKMIRNGKAVKKFRDTDIYYQGTYELDFLDKYYDKFEILRGEPVDYFLDDKKHVYYPDFYIAHLNLIVEIKSSRWYDHAIEKNEAKMMQCLENGFNFMFIFNKKYDEFEKYIS
jgi:hypothetical protein